MKQSNNPAHAGPTKPVTVSLPMYGDDTCEDPDPLGTRPPHPAHLKNGNGKGAGGTSRGTIESNDTLSDPGEAAMVMSDGARRVRDLAFPDATDAEWSDWKWQLRNRIRDEAMLARILRPTMIERRTIAELGDRLPVGITPYYASTINPNDPADPVRKTMVPVETEFEGTIDPDTLRESGWRDWLAFAAWGAALALFVAIGVFAGNVASFEADRIMHPGAWE